MAAAKPCLTIERRFNAPVALVWAAWTDPEHMLNWWATREAVTLRAEADLRVGGRYGVAFRTPDGEIHDVSGIYREVEPLRKLVFSWAWITTPDRVSQVTLMFREDGDSTLLTLLHEDFFDEQARDDHHTGWSEALDKLDAMLLKERKGR